MSYSFQEPEEPAVCECKYDEIHDRMDKEDCPFHGDVLHDQQESGASFQERKRPTIEDLNETADRPAKTA